MRTHRETGIIVCMALFACISVYARGTITAYDLALSASLVFLAALASVLDREREA